MAVHFFLFFFFFFIAAKEFDKNDKPDRFYFYLFTYLFQLHSYKVFVTEMEDSFTR